MNNVRTRLAPSPTGYIHVGTIRTALFSWLLARQNSGEFILRLEDTDQNRLVEGAKEHLLLCLKVLGLNYDEGPDKSGPYGPYIQSERLSIYKAWADKIIALDRAYADPYSKEEVQAFRDQATKDKIPFLYRNHRPANPPKWDGKSPLRFKSDPKNYQWNDLVMGNLKTGPEVIDDFVLMKSDGFPTYNFAHIIDDYEMKISHILRGQEFLSSIPNYLNLYEALGINKPLMATLPHIMASSGNKKLSKRDGAKDVLDYIKEGYLVESLISFIATLGWNDGTTKEIFTKEELIKDLSLERVQRSGAKFDEKRLEWINGYFIRNMNDEQLLESCKDYWGPEAEGSSDKYKLSILKILKDRLKRLGELSLLSNYFFKDLPIDDSLIKENKNLNKFNNSELSKLLELSKEALERSDFSLEDLTNKLNQLITDLDQKPAVLFSIIRIAITEAPSSPGLADTLSVLGKEISLKRIDALTQHLNNQDI